MNTKYDDAFWMVISVYFLKSYLIKIFLKLHAWWNEFGFVVDVVNSSCFRPDWDDYSCVGTEYNGQRERESHIN